MLSRKQKKRLLDNCEDTYKESVKDIENEAQKLTGSRDGNVPEKWNPDGKKGKKGITQHVRYLASQLFKKNKEYDKDMKKDECRKGDKQKRKLYRHSVENMKTTADNVKNYFIGKGGSNRNTGADFNYDGTAGNYDLSNSVSSVFYGSGDGLEFSINSPILKLEVEMLRYLYALQTSIDPRKYGNSNYVYSSKKRGVKMGGLTPAEGMDVVEKKTCGMVDGGINFIFKGYGGYYLTETAVFNKDNDATNKAWMPTWEKATSGSRKGGKTVAMVARGRLTDKGRLLIPERGNSAPPIIRGSGGANISDGINLYPGGKFYWIDALQYGIKMGLYAGQQLQMIEIESDNKVGSVGTGDEKKPIYGKVPMLISPMGIKPLAEKLLCQCDVIQTWLDSDSMRRPLNVNNILDDKPTPLPARTGGRNDNNWDNTTYKNNYRHENCNGLVGFEFFLSQFYSPDTKAQDRILTIRERRTKTESTANQAGSRGEVGLATGFLVSTDASEVLKKDYAAKHYARWYDQYVHYCGGDMVQTLELAKAMKTSNAHVYNLGGSEVSKFNKAIKKAEEFIPRVEAINEILAKIYELTYEAPGYPSDGPGGQKFLNDLYDEADRLTEQLTESDLGKVLKKVCRHKLGSNKMPILDGTCFDTKVDHHSTLYDNIPEISGPDVTRINSNPQLRRTYCDTMGTYNVLDKDKNGKPDPDRIITTKDDNPTGKWPGDNKDYNHWRPDNYKQCVQNSILNLRHIEWKEGRDYGFDAPNDPPPETPELKCKGSTIDMPEADTSVKARASSLAGDMESKYSKRSPNRRVLSLPNNAMIPNPSSNFTAVNRYWANESYGSESEYKKQQDKCFELIKPWHKQSDRKKACESNTVLAYGSTEITGSKGVGNQFNLEVDYPDCTWTEYDYNGILGGGTRYNQGERKLGCGRKTCVAKKTVTIFNDHLYRNNRTAHLTYLSLCYNRYFKALTDLKNDCLRVSATFLQRFENEYLKVNSRIMCFVKDYRQMLKYIAFLFDKVPFTKSAREIVPIKTDLNGYELILSSQVQSILNKAKTIHGQIGKSNRNIQSFNDYFNRCLKIIENITDIDIENGKNFPTFNLLSGMSRYFFNATKYYKVCYTKFISYNETQKRAEELLSNLCIVRRELRRYPERIRGFVSRVKVTYDVLVNCTIVEKIIGSSATPKSYGASSTTGNLNTILDNSRLAIDRLRKYEKEITQLSKALLQNIEVTTNSLNILPGLTRGWKRSDNIFLHYGAKISLSIFESEDQDKEEILTAVLLLNRFGERADVAEGTIRGLHGLGFAKGSEKINGLADIVLLDPGNPINRGPIRYYDPVMISTTNFSNDGLVAFVRYGRNGYNDDTQQVHWDKSIMKDEDIFNPHEYSIEFKNIATRIPKGNNPNQPQFTKTFTLHPEVCADDTFMTLPADSKTGITKYGKDIYVRNNHLVSITPRLKIAGKSQYSGNSGRYTDKSENVGLPLNSSGINNLPTESDGWYGPYTLTLASVNTLGNTMNIKSNSRCYSQPTLLGEVCQYDPYHPYPDKPPIEPYRPRPYVVPTNYDVIFSPGNESGIGGQLSNNKPVKGSSDTKTAKDTKGPVTYLPCKFRISIKEMPSLTYRIYQKRWLGNREPSGSPEHKSGFLTRILEMNNTFDKLTFLVDEVCIEENEFTGECYKSGVREYAKYMYHNLPDRMFTVKYWLGVDHLNSEWIPPVINIEQPESTADDIPDEVYTDTTYPTTSAEEDTLLNSFMNEVSLSELAIKLVEIFADNSSVGVPNNEGGATVETRSFLRGSPDNNPDGLDIVARYDSITLIKLIVSNKFGGIVTARDGVVSMYAFINMIKSAPDRVTLEEKRKMVFDANYTALNPLTYLKNFLSTSIPEIVKEKPILVEWPEMSGLKSPSGGNFGKIDNVYMVAFILRLAIIESKSYNISFDAAKHKSQGESRLSFSSDNDLGTTLFVTSKGSGVIKDYDNFLKDMVLFFSAIPDNDVINNTIATSISPEIFGDTRELLPYSPVTTSKENKTSSDTSSSTKKAEESSKSSDDMSKMISLMKGFDVGAESQAISKISTEEAIQRAAAIENEYIATSYSPDLPTQPDDNQKQVKISMDPATVGRRAAVLSSGVNEIDAGYTSTSGGAKEALEAVLGAKLSSDGSKNKTDSDRSISKDEFMLHVNNTNPPQKTDKDGNNYPRVNIVTQGGTTGDQLFDALDTNKDGKIDSDDSFDNIIEEGGPRGGKFDNDGNLVEGFSGKYSDLYYINDKNNINERFTTYDDEPYADEPELGINTSYAPPNLDIKDQDKVLFNNPWIRFPAPLCNKGGPKGDIRLPSEIQDQRLAENEILKKTICSTKVDKILSDDYDQDPSTGTINQNSNSGGFRSILPIQPSEAP